MDDPPSDRQPLLTGVFLRLTLANFGYFLSLGSLGPVLPRYIDGPLGASRVGVGMGVGAFAITALLLRPWSGSFGDRRGRRLPIVVGSAIHVVGMIGLFAADSLPLLVGARLVTGVGEALFFVGASAAIQDLAPDERRGEAASLFSLSLFAGLALGPLAGEWLLDARGFDAVWTLASAAAVVGFLVALTVPDTSPEHHPAGAPRKLVHPASLKPGFILGCAVFCLAAFNSFIPLYALELGLGGSRWIFLANSVVILGFRSFGARLPDQMGHLRAAKLSLTCTPIGMAIIGLWPAVPAPYVGAVVLAMGQALAFPALMSIAINNAAPSERGAVVGTFTAFFDLSFGGGSVILGSIAGALGFRGAFLAASGVATLGLLTLVFRPPPERRDASLVAISVEPPILIQRPEPEHPSGVDGPAPERSDAAESEQTSD